MNILNSDANTQRVPELDGIRGLAILLVLVWHFFGMLLWVSHGQAQIFGRLLMFTWSGVDLFFVLSGFLIGGILIDAKGSRGYFATFYIRRFFRIVPAYAVACLAYFPLSALVHVTIHSTIAYMPWYTYATFTQNIWLNRDRWITYLSHTWSLAIEEQFYLTLPLLIWLVSPRHLWKVVTTGIAAAISFRVLSHVGATSAYVLLPCRADTLLMGVLAAIAMRNPKAKRRIEAGRAWLFGIVAAWFAVLAWFAARNAGVWSREFTTFGYSGFALFYASILLLTITSKGTMRRFFSGPILRWFGTVAYALYLVHLPLFAVSMAILHRRPFLAFMIPITASLLFSQLSWTFLESRMIAFGHRFTYRTKGAGQIEDDRVNSEGTGQGPQPRASIIADPG